ncbi:LacI family transcriptional regulator [Cryobacterium sp. TMT2-15-1]|uniref:LacI family DNA-binding transcriptional regulator n=1 Tax=Cryobacterium sp. TMT2-15-1 TaxID=1259246 RepID=UPI00106CC518|nr:LacI family DNA-binding transcriptional regulator [Cryobacterium sp. TMT2-15-1]TFC55792.1 LacI family transcriptional regulator [Cryobacterium sp. TMT2-15-1]
MAKQSVTRSDVAKYAGVSTAVVSYVINGLPGRVAPATAKRVREAIDTLQYQPNYTARALKLGISQLIGIVVPDTSNPHFVELASAIERAASAHGYDLIITNSRSDPAREVRNTESLVSRGVEAIITLSLLADEELASQRVNGIPRVFIDQSTVVHGVATISTAFRDGAKLGVRHLVEHGHHNIGMLVGGRRGSRSLDARQLGWQDALREANLELGPIELTDYSRRGGYEATQRLLQRTPRPTAIFASSDLEAIGALLAIHENGLSVPRDMAVVSFDGTIETEFSWPPLTTVRQPTEELAKAAVAAALDPASRNVGQSLFPAKLVVRSSCGCLVDQVP